MMLSKAEQLLGRLLVEKGFSSKEHVDAALSEASSTGVSFVSLLIARGTASEEECLRLLADILRLEYREASVHAVSKNVIAKIPVKIASYYKFFPLDLRDRILTIAVSRPLDLKTEDEIRAQLGFDLKVVLSKEADVAKMFKSHYGVGAETIGDIISASPDEGTLQTETVQEKIEDIERQAQEASVTKLVNQILLEAYKRRATDIHLEPYRNKVKLRYRIDGVLYDVNISQDLRHLFSSILSRIKIMSNLNIVERRLAQDGRAVVKAQDQTLDLRVSFIPTPYGESVVIRILPTSMLFSLEKLGLSQAQLKDLEDLIRKPHGIIFVTGPTGSGKTTTLYACLSRINTSERKIITIEDPIEYEMEGITQIQVSPEIGWTFAKGLRSMLRHDPDVMMVGEVRDLETAEIAIRVALTGHLVVSTLHTNDAASSITRLTDIGVEPYLVASSVEAFIAQRLVRVICPACKMELPQESDDAVTSEVRRQITSDLALSSVRDARLYKGQGCQECNFTGFFGRTGIYESILSDSMIKELIVKKATSAQIKKIAVSRGMKTLRQDGWLKVLQGITTFDEVIKVTQAEEAPAPAPERPFLQEGARSEEGASQLALPAEGKRVYVRFESRVNIRYKVFKSLEEMTRRGFRPENLSVTANIGAGGFLFFSSEALPVSSIVELKLELPDSGAAVACLAKVVRVEEIEPEKNYHIAVQFLDISSADRARINRFVME